MIARTISAILLSAAAVLVLYIGGLTLEIALYLCIALCTYEVHTAFRREGIHVSAGIGLFFLIMLPIAIHIAALKGILSLFMITGMLGLSIQVFRSDLTVVNTAFTLFTLFYPCMMLSMLPLMMTFPGEGGRIAIIFTILTATATDTLALYAGMFFGKHKLSPAISPKKTVEGAVGGLLGGGIIGYAMGQIIKAHFFDHAVVWQLTLLGLVGSVAGQIGDLSASIIKRSAGIKDFGRIFPGHGGMMDRADSILFIAPVVYCYFSIVVFAA
jgi:phosphatidate cytidylyltransferase